METPRVFFLPSGPAAASRPRNWLHGVLFALAVSTTVVAGFILQMGFAGESLAPSHLTSIFLSNPFRVLEGVPFSATLLGILLAHEMGHYLTCRFYGIRASLPYFLPAPPFLVLPPSLASILGFTSGFIPFNPFGTFGAVIRIRSPFVTRRQLLDVGIAGPLAGFIVILPAVVVGLALSRQVLAVSPALDTLQIAVGKPLLFILAGALFASSDGMALSLHPIGLAAWFGMLATSINLLPIGQLDGGHIVYALFGRRVHRVVSFLAFSSLIGLSLFSWPMLGYLFFALILLVMGFRHPPPLREDLSPGKSRILLAVAGLIVFVLTFIPVPIRLIAAAG